MAMSKTNGSNTPGGKSTIELMNPLSSETRPTDSGEGNLLHKSNMNMSTPTEPVLNAENQVLLQQNKLSQNEQMLYNQWRNAVTETENLKAIIVELQKQVEQLKNNTPQKKAEYSTDEEQLAKDTEWIRVKRRAKKRKIKATPSPPTSIIRTTRSQEKEEKELAKKTTKENTPPPIIVDDFKSYDIFYEALTKRVPEKNLQVKLINKTTTKINCIDAECYREVIDILSQNKYMYHTYENKQIRPIRVIVKNLHYSCNPDKIVAFLEEKNYKIISADNKKTWKDKQPLNMFMLTFDNSENIEKIYKITNILGSKVEILPLRSNRLIPQCKNCQGFGHTQRYCSKEAKCVKCAGKHSTKNCTKTKEQKPKCVNCGENHPANYRGCYVAKELQKLKNQKNKKLKQKSTITTIVQATNNKITDKATNNKKTQNKSSYASVVASEPVQQSLKGGLNKEGTKEELSINQSLQHILKIVSNLENSWKVIDERVKKLENGTRKAIQKTKKYL